MKRSSLVLSSAVTLTLAGMPLMAQSDTYTTSRKGSSPVTSCDQIDSNWKGKVMERSAQMLSVPGGSGGLTVADLRNSAIYVTSGSGSGYEITVCKVAAGDSGGEASRLLRGIGAEVRGGRLHVSGPDRGAWAAHLIIRAPANAVMDLDTTNGPISLHEVSGRIKLRATNGPISLTRSSGNIDAASKNGPISLNGGAGEMTLNAQNGPITVKLEDPEWRGGNLEAHTKNGPLSLRLPDGFRSGVIVDASKHSPVTCDCDGARTTNAEGKTQRFEFGLTAPVIRMSTVNGPVSIKADGVVF